MAIAFDNSSAAANTSLSYTVTGTKPVLYVGIVGNATDNITGVTYGGVSLEQIAKGQNSTKWCYLYRLNNPPTGTNTLAVSGVTSPVMFPVSYTGVSYYGSPDVLTQAAATADTATLTLTPSRDGSWALMFVVWTNGGGTISAGTGTTKLQQNAFSQVIGHSNGAISPAASTSLAFTNPTSGYNYIAFMVAIGPDEGPLPLIGAAFAVFAATGKIVSIVTAFFGAMFGILSASTSTGRSVTNVTKHTASATNVTKH